MAQQVLTEEEIESLLRNQRLLRVAFHAEGHGYLIPLGYVWLDGAFYILSTPGEKTRMAGMNPLVTFQVDDAPATGFLNWSSVTGEGRWEVEDDPVLRERVVEDLLLRFPEMAAWGMEQYAKQAASGELLLVRIRPTWMTGRHFHAE